MWGDGQRTQVQDTMHGIMNGLLWLQGYVALCLAVHDAAPPDVLEWVNWHHLAGVDRFVVFDLGSAPPLNQVQCH
jgi:hypothetical protein